MLRLRLFAALLAALALLLPAHMATAAGRLSPKPPVPLPGLTTTTTATATTTSPTTTTAPQAPLPRTGMDLLPELAAGALMVVAGTALGRGLLLDGRGRSRAR